MKIEIENFQAQNQVNLAKLEMDAEKRREEQLQLEKMGAQIRSFAADSEGCYFNAEVEIKQIKKTEAVLEKVS